jgi:hypothetical protein
MEWKKRIRIERVKVAKKNLTPAPVGTTTLTPEQIAPLRKVWDQLQRFPGLEPGTFEQFEADFSRDSHPDREIGLYENVAARLRKVKKPRRAKQVYEPWLKDCTPIVVGRPGKNAGT